MQHYDVFNGDADGLCALHQLRLADPRDSILVTGVKRDIALLSEVPHEQCSSATVLDLSMEKNKVALVALLEKGKPVHYVDHHFPGEIPSHTNLHANIDTRASVCTSLLVDTELNARFRAWAVVAAFGDNLHHSAHNAAKALTLGPTDLAILEKLGTLINYNAYGSSVEDLFYAPDDLYRHMQSFSNPISFAHEHPCFKVLENGYQQDMANALSVQPKDISETHALYILPKQCWARRVSGVFANTLVHQAPARAHAVLIEKADGGYLVSVRAPLHNRSGADQLCRQFKTGGGREAAAGINHLEANQLEAFNAALQRQFNNN